MLCGGLRLRPNKRIYYVSNGLFNVNNPIQSLNSTPHPPRGSNKHEAVITNLTAVNNHNFIRCSVQTDISSFITHSHCSVVNNNYCVKKKQYQDYSSTDPETS